MRTLWLALVAAGCSGSHDAKPPAGPSMEERRMAVLPQDRDGKRVWSWPTFSPDGRHCGWIEEQPDGRKIAMVDGRPRFAPQPDI